MRFCDLCEKAVINVEDCCKLGNVADIEFDECTGCICALIVPECNHFFSLFGPAKELIIPWNQVIKIGPDIILVKLCREDKKKH